MFDEQIVWLAVGVLAFLFGVVIYNALAGLRVDVQAAKTRENALRAQRKQLKRHTRDASGRAFRHNQHVVRGATRRRPR